MKKRLLLSLLCLALVGSVWGQANDNYAWFDQSNIYVNNSQTSSVSNKIWYDGMTSVGLFYGELPYPAAYDDFVYTWKVVSGTIDEDDVSVKHNNNAYEVTIAFPANSKGIIEVTAKNEVFEPGNTFTCVCRVYINVAKRWEFNVKPFTLDNESAWNSNATSMSTEGNHFKYHEFLYTQANNTSKTNVSADDLVDYDATNNLTNAYLAVHEADGLRFITGQYNFGYNDGRDWATQHHDSLIRYPQFIKNGNIITDKSKDKNCYTRFLCFKAGSKIIIPKEQYFSYDNPRVRIKMNRDAIPHSALDLVIKNATDAVGTEFNATNGYYDIGGSSWWGLEEKKSDCLYRGEYQFQIVDKFKNFVLEIPSSTGNNNANCWFLLYSIEVYDSKELITENSILGYDANNSRAQKYQFLHTKYLDETGNVIEETKPTAANYNIHYRGKSEATKVAECTTTGTVGTKATDSNLNGDNFINRFDNINGSVSPNYNHKYTPIDGEYGTFRMRIGVYTHSGKYCTDYAYRTMSVGYMENKQYPYTWDLTDVTRIVNGVSYWNSDAQDLEDEYEELQGTLDETTNGTPNYKLGKTNIPRNLWEDGTTAKWETQLSETKTGKGLRVANDAGYDVLYCGGSQLWYGDKIIPETAGLAFTPVNFDATYNSAMIFGNTGMTSYNDVRDWWMWRITVPKVTPQDVIYVRGKLLQDIPYTYVEKGETKTDYHVGYVYGDANNKTVKNAFGTNGTVKIEKAEGNILGNGEVVFAIPSPSSTQNVTLFFTGIEVQKIAVSRDSKKVNIKGWTTESRARVIDPELTSYMTGYDLATYVVEKANYTENTVTLSEFPYDKKVMKKSLGIVNGMDDKNACIIFNKKEAEVKILNDGFHLFVPDMHDFIKDRTDGLTNVKTELDMSNYMLRSILNAKETLPPFCTIDGTAYTNYALSYRHCDVKEDGTPISDHTAGDEAFYRVATGTSSSANKGYLPLPTASVKPNGGSTAPSLSIVFNNDDSDINGIENTMIYTARPQNNVYYNLNGQMFNGVPTSPGLYIVNGKKVIIK